MLALRTTARQRVRYNNLLSVTFVANNPSCTSLSVGANAVFALPYPCPLAKPKASQIRYMLARVTFLLNNSTFR